MKTEKVFGGIILIGLIFRFMHWPFAGPILVIGFGTLMMIYLIGAFYFFCDENIKRQNLALSIISGFFLMNACMAIFYKLMFWPFSEPLLRIAITTTPVLLGAIFLLRSTTTRTDLATYYNNMIIRSSVITALVIVFYFTSSVTLVKIIHSDDQEWVRLQTRSIENPENEEYRKEYNDYIDAKYGRHANGEEK